jgi:hypothetical protein
VETSYRTVDGATRANVLQVSRGKLNPDDHKPPLLVGRRHWGSRLFSRELDYQLWDELRELRAHSDASTSHKRTVLLEGTTGNGKIQLT